MDNKNRDIIKSRILWTIAMSLISVLFIMSVSRKLNNHVSNLVVKIKPIKGDKDLMYGKEVEKMVTNYLGYDVTNSSVKELDTKDLEDILQADKRVKKVEVFLDSKDRLNVWIVQKQPVVRIMDSKSVSYYLDEDGKRVPTARYAAIRVPVATGEFELFDSTFYNLQKPSKLREVYNVCKYIASDDFLSALIEQVVVDENKDLVLIPKMGKQKILIGDDQLLDEKFGNLKIMYKEGLPREGWKKYSVLNIKYKGVLYGTVRQENL